MNVTTVVQRLAWAKQAIDRLPSGRMRSIAQTKLEASLIYAIAAAQGVEDLFALPLEDKLRATVEGTIADAEARGWIETKPALSGVLRARTYDLLTEAVEQGVGMGWMRAHKHTRKPTEEAIKENIEREIMNSIFERFDTE